MYRGMLLFAALSAPAAEADAVATRLIESKDRSVSRADAILMDDRPDVRAALKREVVRRKLLPAYQANVIDEGFGEAVQVLVYARQAYSRRIAPSSVPLDYDSRPWEK